MEQKVDILGSEWTVEFAPSDKYDYLKTTDGFCDPSIRRIVVDDMTTIKADDSKADLMQYRKQVLRHETIHAFLAESGLDGNSNKVENWDRNEEMVDWIAIQGPKIIKAWQQLDVL